jgi:chromosome segregation ATPase
LHYLLLQLQIASATLLERSSQLQTLQRELEQRRNNQDGADSSLRKLQEENVRLQAKAEAQQEKYELLSTHIICVQNLSMTILLSLRILMLLFTLVNPLAPYHTCW